MYKTTHCYILPVLHWLFGPCRPRTSFRINFQMSLSLAIFLQALTLFFVWHYSPWWTLASSKIVLRCTRSCVVVYIRFPILDASQQIYVLCKLDFCLTVHHQLGKVIQMDQLDATMIYLYVLWVQVVSLMPNPQPGGIGSPFCLGHHLWPV